MQSGKASCSGKRLGLLLAVCLLMACVSIVPQSASATPIGSTGYHLTDQVVIPGDGNAKDLSWDYFIFNPDTRTLYLNHRGRGVMVMNIDTKKVLGVAERTDGACGTAVVNDLNKGYTATGKRGEGNIVAVFDLTTLKWLKDIEVSPDADAILYDPLSKMVYVNTEAGMVVIDPQTDSVVKTIDLGSHKVEYPALDGKGHIFVNLQDKNQVVEVDTKSYEVIQRWSTGRAEVPTSLCYDADKNRLIIGGRGGVAAIMDAANGKILAELPIGFRVDTSLYDPVTKLIFLVNENKFINVIKEVSPNNYELVDTIWTLPYANRAMLDPKTHNLYIGSADFSGPPAKKGGPPTIIPDSFIFATISR